MTNCQNVDACYSIHVPEDSAKSGQGDIFFQIKAPTSYSWVAFGQGDGMVGSNIFVMYADASGKNVTVSPRYAAGYFQPQHDTDAQIEMLEGSGISDGNMVANVLCTNCNNWGTGSMRFNDPASSWVYAYKAGDPINSDSPSANIVKHDNSGTFTFDLTNAAGGADSTNPFVASNGSSTVSNSTTSGTGTTSTSDSASEMFTNNMIIAHGTLMGFTMVILFPLGASLRVLASSSSIWIHAGVQMLAWSIAIAGMGIGIWVALNTQQLMMYHPIIGLVVVSTMSLLPIGGLLQHRHYKKHGTRGIWGIGHKVLGVSLITLGIINGGFGLMLSDNSMQAEIAYGVIAGVVGLAWLSLAAFGEARRGTKPPTSREKGDDRASSSPTQS